MILIHEVARVSDYFTVYRDSQDTKLFYYIPQFAEVAKTNDGKLNFGAVLFRKNQNDPNDGFSLYNFGVRGVLPSAELSRILNELEQQYGTGVAIQPINPSVATPVLRPLTDGFYRSIRCQSHGGNLFTDLSGSFTLDESLEPDFAHLMQSAVGWAGEIVYKILTKRTTFEWSITANWHAVHEHFKSQVSVKYWFVSANLSYEVESLITKGIMNVKTSGGTPEQREKIFTLASEMAARMFNQTLQPNPLPDHPSGSVVCLSVNYSRTFLDKEETWTGEVSEFEEKELGMAAYLREIPANYFVNFDKRSKGLEVDLDALDSHSTDSWWNLRDLNSKKDDTGIKVHKATSKKG